MQKLKKNDKVKILSGKDKGKIAKILKVFASSNRALVEGVNLAKKHMKQRRQDVPGGIISKESPLHISNLLLVCAKCNRATKIGIKVLADGTKERYCKRCQEVV